jgi:BolA-like protein 1
MINDCVKSELKDKFPHALSIEAKTPVQWDENYTVDPSPNCRGGFGK